jgi:hypothetical protein
LKEDIRNRSEKSRKVEFFDWNKLSKKQMLIKIRVWQRPETCGRKKTGRKERTR